MEEQGLIDRRPNPEEGRGVLIHLTNFGKEMREFSKGVVFKFDKAVKEQVSEEDIKTFKKVASSITELIGNKSVYK